MPEEMPTPKKSLKELERKKKLLEDKEKKMIEEIKQRLKRKFCKGVIKMNNENKVNINWEITIYGKLLRKTYK